MSVTSIHSGKRRARIMHECSLCGRPIQSGETYDYSDNLWDGEYRFTWKECSHCYAMVRLLDLPGDWDYYNEETVSEYDWRSWSDLRLLIQWRRRWRRRDGALYEVPAAR